MKVYVNAVQLESHQEFGVAEFFGTLSDDFQVLEHAKRERVLTVAQKGDCFYGMMVSSKDQRKLLTLGKKPDGSPKVTVLTTVNGEPMADFNWFVIHKKTGAGLMTTYQGGGGRIVLENVLSKIYHERVQKRIDAEIEEAGEAGEDVSEKGKRTIRKKYRHANLKITPIILEQSLAARLSRLAELHRFEYVEIQSKEPMYEPVKLQISKVKKTIAFKRDREHLATLKKFVMATISAEKINEGSISGKRSDGSPDVVQINEEYFCVDKWEHDEVVSPSNLDLETPSTRPVAAKLRKLMDQHPVVFFGKV